MDLRRLLVLGLVAVPDIAAAQDSGLCEDLFRQLRAAPEIIGSTQEMRRYAQELGEANNGIRKLRIELRRSGCGGGSIVRLGDAGEPADPGCAGMRHDLRALEEEREALAAERRSRLNLVRSSDDRADILAAIRDNNCTPHQDEPDQDEEQEPLQDDGVRVPGLELPKDDGPYSGITDLRTRHPQRAEAARAEPPPVPDRPYDPNKTVRMVGPTFFPEDSIDLAHPKGAPQAQQ